MIVAIGSNQNLYHAFVKAEDYFYHYGKISIPYLTSLNDWLNENYNIRYYQKTAFRNDLLEFNSEEDMFLFLLE